MVTVGAAKAPRPEYAFDSTYVKRFVQLHKHLGFKSWRSLSCALFGALVCVCALEQFLAYKIGMVPGQFYKVLGGKDYDGFLKTTLFSLILIVCMVSPIYVITYVVSFD